MERAAKQFGLWSGDGMVLPEGDQALEASAPAGVVFGTRLFDAGPFHAGFGVIVQPDEDTIETCVQSVTRFGRVPFRHSLAATLYGDALRMDLPPSGEEQQLVHFLLERLTNGPSRDDGAPAAPKRRRRRG